ncbi:MAG: VapE domain-containing protein [Halioglobus sp.]
MMETMTELQTAFMKLFRGLDRAHGNFEITGSREDGKYEGKARTLAVPPTADLFKRHLSGDYSLGIVPITDENTCAWGAIDIDVYPVDFDELERKIHLLGLPLVVTKSKSNGAHLWLFLNEPVSAELVRNALTGWACALGYPGIEVFPKQSTLRSRQDTGNWINLPYFGDARTLAGGGDLGAFVVKAGARSQSLEELAAITIGDAPPCIQALLRSDELGTGTRNEGLFNIAIYLRQAGGPELLADHLENIRVKLCPDLPERECEGIARSVGGEKEYFYRCGEQPVCDVCNRDACKTRKFGINASRGNPSYPDKTKNRDGSFRAQATLENLVALMEFMGVTVNYNVITKRLTVQGIDSMKGDEEAAVIAELTSMCAKYGLSKATVGDFIDRIAKKNPINPVVDWLQLLPVASGDPIGDFVTHCQFEDHAWAKSAFTRWFIQAVAAADHATLTPNAVARSEFPYVLVLAGPQGIRKTSLMYDLLGEKSDLFTAGRMLDTSNKDSLLAALSNWIIELGEIDSTFRKSDIAALKAFLTDPSDDIRKPYARASTLMARRTAFFATVNQLRFLQDETGNRRFWPVEMIHAIAPLPDGLSERIWAWAWQQYLAGEQWWLTREEEKQHTGIVCKYEDKPLKARVLDCYDFDEDTRTIRITATEILKEIGWPSTDKSALTKLGLILKELGIQKSGRRARQYAMPPRSSGNSRNWFNEEDEVPMQ